jgi:Tfp pilus assembly protein PilV
MTGAVRQEAGFGLVEVLVSSLLLAVLAIGLLAQIDGPAALSGANKARSTAAALAQQDQERLRALKSTTLSNYDATRAATLGRVTYTVKSKGVWVSDASSTESCTSNDAQAHYLKITSTVTWPSIGAGKPVKAVSLVAPSASLAANTGNLAVQLTTPAGAPIADLPVTVAPGAVTVATNSAGCAFFPLLAIGAYQATFGGGGLVDPSGASSVSLNGSVVSGATTTLSDSLGQAAQASVTFDTKVGAAAAVPAQSTTVTIVNSGMPAPGSRTSTFASLQTAISLTNVYPFTSGYGAYAGTCSAANPTQYNSSYYTQNPTRYLNVTPGGSGSVTVREPALNVTVKRSGSAYANAHAVVTATGSGCTNRVVMSSSSSGVLVMGAAPYQAPAMPFGTYSVCADDGTRQASVTVSNTDPSGNQAANTVLNVPTSGSKSVCT